MTPPLLGAGEEGQSNVTLLGSSASAESTCQNGSVFKERNYMGLSDCSSVDSSTVSNTSEANDGSCLNLKATELRLGLPGSQSPERDSSICLKSSGKLDEKPLFPLHPLKDGNYSLVQRPVTSGNKRGFSDAMDGFSEVKLLNYIDWKCNFQGSLLRNIRFCFTGQIVFQFRSKYNAIA